MNGCSESISARFIGNLLGNAIAVTGSQSKLIPLSPAARATQRGDALHSEFRKKKFKETPAAFQLLGLQLSQFSRR
jgi:hypothetical protein